MRPSFDDFHYLRMTERPRLRPHSKAFRIVDLFAGTGSLSLGVWEACRRNSVGFESVAAIDMDPEVMQVYRRNFPGSSGIAVDARILINGSVGSKLTPEEKRLRKFLGKIDMLVSGSPCQGFSPLNNHTRGRDKRNALYLRATRLVEVVRPMSFLFENVPNVVNSVRDVVGRSKMLMVKLGYCVDEGIIDLSSIGVPQTRKRHVLLGSRKKEVSVQTILERFRTYRKRTVRWGIGDLEKRTQVGIFDTASKQTQDNIKRIAYLYRTNQFDLPNSRRPECQQDSHSYKSMYSRLRYDKPAQTITSGFGSPGQGRFLHPMLHRTLTPHEAARLQLFPDFFDFSSVSKRTSLATMIGNAATWKLSFVFASTMIENVSK